MTIRDVEAAMHEQPRGAETIFTGYPYGDLERTDGQGQDEEITATVVTAGQ